MNTEKLKYIAFNALPNVVLVGTSLTLPSPTRRAGRGFQKRLVFSVFALCFGSFSLWEKAGDEGTPLLVLFALAPSPSGRRRGMRETPILVVFALAPSPSGRRRGMRGTPLLVLFALAPSPRAARGRRRGMRGTPRTFTPSTANTHKIPSAPARNAPSAFRYAF
jgi:hypothetical protein